MARGPVAHGRQHRGHRGTCHIPSLHPLGRRRSEALSLALPHHRRGNPHGRPPCIGPLLGPLRQPTRSNPVGSRPEDHVLPALAPWDRLEGRPPALRTLRSVPLNRHPPPWPRHPPAIVALAKKPCRKPRRPQFHRRSRANGRLTAPDISPSRLPPKPPRTLHRYPHPPPGNPCQINLCQPILTRIQQRISLSDLRLVPLFG